MTVENERRKDPARNDPSVPDKVRGLIQDLDENEQSTALSEHRTGLSEHRTGLSEHRTALSEHRTELSEHRTKLSDARSFMANERTHLAYTRTSVSLMSFGVTINRFSIYLMENNRMPTGGAHPLRDTENLGIAMLLLGVLMLVWSLFRYRSVNQDIAKQEFTPTGPIVTLVTAVLIACGAGGVMWVILK